MNILFLAGIYPGDGGVEQITTALANEFHQRGGRIGIASFLQRERRNKLTLHPDVDLIALKLPVLTARNVKTLKHYITQKKIDVIINQWCIPWQVNALCRLAVRGSRCRFITVHHGLPSTNNRIMNLERLIHAHPLTGKLLCPYKWFVERYSALSLRLSIRLADKLVLLSPSFIAPLEKFIGKRLDEKVVIIPNGIVPLEEPPSIEKKKKVVLYVGRIENIQKRTTRLVSIWKHIEPIHPDWQLKIVGSGPDEQHLRDAIRRHGLKNISLEGVKDPSPYYNEAQLLLLTSEYEGFGIVMIEAMQHAVPTIAYGACAVISEVIDHGQTGLVTPTPFNAKQMADHVCSLINAPEALRTMQQKAFAKAKQYDISLIADIWEKKIGCK